MNRSSTAWIFRIASALMAILLFCAFLFAVSEPDATELPKATSFDPGGAAGFAELLRQEGYQVSIAAEVPARVSQSALVIGFFPGGTLSRPPLTEAKEEAATEARLAGHPDMTTYATPAMEFVLNHAAGGGRALLLPFFAHVPAKAAPPVNAKDPNGKHYKLSLGDESMSHPEALPDPPSGSSDSIVSSDAWLSGQNTVGSVTAWGDGIIATMASGTMAMNGLIANDDNAEFLTNVVQHLAGPKREVVILDALITGGSPPGLLDVLGHWSVGLRAQTLVLLGVILLSLSIRFGLAIDPPPAQRASRDLLEAVADTYARNGAGQAALQRLTAECDQRLRRRFLVPKDAPKVKRNDLLPPEVASALAACEENLVRGAVLPAQAAKLIEHLERVSNPYLRRK